MTLRHGPHGRALLVLSLLSASAVAQTPAVPVLPEQLSPEATKQAEEIPTVRSSEVRVSEFGTCDVIVQNDDITNVLQKLAIQARKNIVPSPGVSRFINATMYGVPFEDALDALLKPNGLDWEKHGEFIFVFTAEEMAARSTSAENLESRRIHLDYLRSEDAAEYAKALLTEKGSITATKDLGGGGGESGGSASGSQDTVGIYTPDKDEFALENGVVVHDAKDNVERVAAFLKSIDTQPEQVLLEATVLEVDINEQNAWGVDFAMMDGVQFTSFFGFPENLTGGALPSDALQPSNNLNTNFIQSTPGNVASGDGTLKIGITSEDDIGIFIRALDQITDVTLLSNPKVLTLNRQRSKVLVGIRVAYLETTVVENQVLQTIKFIDTGITLEVRPYILKDRRVRMEISPKVSEVVFRLVETQSGVVQELPDEKIQTVQTDILVPEGDTAILGGLFREDTTRGRSQVPVIGDIPIIGYAFEGQDDTLKRVEVIFMIKPTVMSENVLARQGDEGLAYYERIRVGSRLGLLPWSRERQSAYHNLKAQKAAAAGEFGWARFHLRRSIQLHPNQPEMIRMQEQLTDEEFWPTRNMFERIVDQQLDQDFPAAKAGSAPKPPEPTDLPPAPPSGETPPTGAGN